MKALKQSRFMSMVESWVNIAIGFSINFTANLTILPALGLPITVKDALWIGLIFTVISIIRSYYLRRVFEWVRERYGNWNPFGWKEKSHDTSREVELGQGPGESAVAAVVASTSNGRGWGPSGPRDHDMAGPKAPFDTGPSPRRGNHNATVLACGGEEAQGEEGPQAPSRYRGA